MPPVAISGRKSRKISCTPHINALSLQCENKITTLSACPSSFLGGHALFKTLDHHFLSIEDIHTLILLSHTEHRFFCVSVIAGKKTGNLTKLAIGWQLMSDNYAAIRNVVVQFSQVSWMKIYKISINNRNLFRKIRIANRDFNHI